ncbi:MAG TPA: 5-oxoprolinase subunit PxpB [Gemmatimonadales bacterium]|nr:5-oxoprolinase subunit PxpB [Gemmatimonadales bacterium]
MSLPAPTVHPLGEGAWTVALGEHVDPAIHERVLALAAQVARAELPFVQEIVPAYAALSVFFDPLRADAEAIREQLTALAAEPLPTPGPAELPTARLVTVPVRYDGPDLEEVAARTGLTRAEVVRRHTSREYRVYLLGFAPGFAYLGELDPALVLPRRREPRTRVAAGSVAIAGAQTAVYPLATPGGWHLLGSTATRMFDPQRDPPALLQPGDRVRFEAIE